MRGEAQTDEDWELEKRSERVKEKVSQVSTASSELLAMLEEFEGLLRQRQDDLTQIHSQINTAEVREAELRAKVEALKKIDFPVADYFKELSEPYERQSKYRDYAIFAVGLVVQPIISLMLKAFGIDI